MDAGRHAPPPTHEALGRSGVTYVSICDACTRGHHDHSTRNVDMPGLFNGPLSHNDYCDCEEKDNVNDGGPE